jgi:hypothetical protein
MIIGEYAVKSFVAATAASKEGGRCISDGPINKYNIQSDAFKFPDIRII